MIRLDTSDTVAAISSPQGESIRSILRLSGPQSWDIATRLLKALPETEPVSARAWAVETEASGPIPAFAGRLQFWPAGRSYTGQESIELHLDVPNVLAENLLRQCVACGARLAEPGEFTLRAFLLGRMDLTRAEAVAEIFQATNPDRMKVALEQLAGGVGRKIEKLRDRLLDLSAWLEATLDFVEEADVDPISRNVVAEEIRGASWELGCLCRMQIARDKPVSTSRIMLVGRPNAGKSLLFNTLCGDSGRALVSPVAGTTRDYLEATIELGEGATALLVDTAGEDDPADDIDHIAQALGQRERVLADLFLVCVPVDASETDFAAFDASLHPNVPRAFVRTKSDLGETGVGQSGPQPAIPVSAATGAGIEALRRLLRERLRNLDPETGSVVAGTRIRAGDSLRRASEALQRAARTMGESGGDELVAIDLRIAVEALDVVTGRDATEETLDRIFSRFCIGK